jgi:uncharacterized integral membrane protein
MRKFLNAAVLIPLGVILVVFAVANRHFVRVSFDPFNSNDAALGFDVPLFVLIVAVAILGVVVGGLATWFGQRRWRRAARQHEADARKLRAQLSGWRSHAAISQRQDSNLPAALAEGAYRRDKQGATL